MQALDKVAISIPEGKELINITQLVFKPLGLSVVAILGIIVLAKVPSWVNQVLGTQNNDEVGLSPLKATAGVISRAGVGTIASRMGGASWLRSAGSGIAQAIPGGKTIGQAIGSKQSRLAQEARDNKQLEAMNRVVQAVEGYYK